MDIVFVGFKDGSDGPSPLRACSYRSPSMPLLMEDRSCLESGSLLGYLLVPSAGVQRYLRCGKQKLLSKFTFLLVIGTDISLLRRWGCCSDEA